MAKAVQQRQISAVVIGKEVCSAPCELGFTSNLLELRKPFGWFVCLRGSASDLQPCQNAEKTRVPRMLPLLRVHTTSNMFWRVRHTRSELMARGKTSSFSQKPKPFAFF